ncbi:MAG: hypothetical protein GY808_11010, partial [Gammaproteobacteria bacterium]|nr:hypothetical protein [Gammaproteobacteria bacterium]
ANIMIIAQLEEGFAGYWTGITNDQGNFTINLPDTAVGTIWNIELFNDDYENYIVDDHYEDVSIHAGANSGFNFHFDLPSSYVYGRLIDDQGIDVILNDHAMLTNTNSNGHFDSEIIDGHFLIPIAFEPGKNSGQFRLYIWGEFLPPNYMVPQFWNNDDYTFTINEGDSIEKNIILQRTDEEIYVQILLDGEAPEMAFEVQAYDDQGQTYTITSNEGWGTLAVKGTGYYNLFVTFDDEDLDPLPTGYTFEGGSSTSAAAGDTAKFYIVGSTSAISGKLSFADGNSQVEYDAEEFRIRIEESEWSEPQGIYLNDSLNYHFDLLDGIYRMWFETHRDD